jgi:hypothetical protein
MNKTANRLTDMEFDEVSLVTRPANQLSKVLLFKSDTESEEEMPEEEVEVVETEAVEEATEVAEEVVEKKGKMKKMPKMEIEVSEEDDMEDDMEDEESPMKKKNENRRRMRKEDESEEIEIPTEVFEYIEALESANEELMASIEKMQADIDAENAQVEEEIFKSADPRLVEIIKAAEERATAAESIAKAERDFRLEREFVSKASELDALPVKADEFGLLLKSVADVLTEKQYDAIWQVLTAANAGIAKSAMFGEVGKSSAPSDNDGPMNIIEKAASRLMNDEPNLTKEQAIAKAVAADANLYTQYIREER